MNKFSFSSIINKQLLIEEYKRIINEEEFINEYNQLYLFYNVDSSVDYKTDFYVFPHDLIVKKKNKIVKVINSIKDNNEFTTEDKIINIEKLNIYIEKLIHIRKTLTINFKIIEKLIKERKEDKKYLENELTKLLEEYDKCNEAIKECTHLSKNYKKEIKWKNENYLNNYYNSLLKLVKELKLELDYIENDSIEKNIAILEIKIADYLEDIDNKSTYIDNLKIQMNYINKYWSHYSPDEVLDLINIIIFKYRLLCNNSESDEELEELYKKILENKYSILEWYAHKCIEYPLSKDYKKELYLKDIEKSYDLFKLYYHFYNDWINNKTLEILTTYKDEMLNNDIFLTLLLYEDYFYKSMIKELLHYERELEENRDYETGNKIHDKIIDYENRVFNWRMSYFYLEINIKDYLKDKYFEFKEICKNNYIIINDIMSIETFMYLYCNIYNKYKELIELHKSIFIIRHDNIGESLFKGISSIDFNTRVGRFLLDLYIIRYKSRNNEIIIDNDVKEFILRDISNIDLPSRLVFGDNLENLIIEKINSNLYFHSIEIPSTIKELSIKDSNINEVIKKGNENNYTDKTYKSRIKTKYNH